MTFHACMAAAFGVWIGMQAFIIIGGVLRVVPLTGITLPFVSYGGSSLLANYVLLGLLIRISDSTARRTGEVPNTLTYAERFEARRARKESKPQGTSGFLPLQEPVADADENSATGF